MKSRKFIKEKKAVAGVIEALLLVALVSIVISTIQLVYIPEIMEQRESDHMDEVENQFAHLKSVIDIQCMIGRDVPITSPITLGSRELPYFVTARAFGELSILGTDNNNYEINIDYGAKVFPMTSIKYKSYNSYFVDQIYAFEGGCIIVKQQDGEAVRVEPIINVENKTSSNKIDIYYEIPIIVGISGKNSTNGYKNCFIRTNYSKTISAPGNNWISITNVSSINISTDYSIAWYSLLKYLLKENVNIDKGSEYTEVSRKPYPSKEINFYYKETYIYAQIGPGWIN